MRLFAALHLPETYQERLAALTERLSKRLDSRITWTRPGNWHLTLKFLGETDPETAERVLGALAAVRFESFSLLAGGGGFFPGPLKPRVIWVGLRQGASEAAALARDVERVLVPLGFPPEKREFRPHLTIGRVKRHRKDPWKDVEAELQEVLWPEALVEAFTLYKSTLTPKGPVYQPLLEVPAGRE